MLGALVAAVLATDLATPRAWRLDAMVGWLEGWKGLPPRHLIERPGVFQKSTPQSKMNQTRRRHSAHLSFVRENLLHWTNWRPSIGTHGLVLWVCAYLALLGNTSFLSARGLLVFSAISDGTQS